MKALTVLCIEGKSLRGVKEATLVNIPNLKEMSIGAVFWFVQEVVISNASLLEKESRGEMIVRGKRELQNGSRFSGRLVFNSSCFPSFIDSVDMAAFPVLRELIVGKGCLKNVDELILVEKEYLEVLEIGNKCFSKCKGKLEVSDCKKLKSVRIGSNSCVCGMSLC